MRNLYPEDDPRFVASRVLVDAEEEEGIGRSNDLDAFMRSLIGDSHVIHIHEDMDEGMVLRATWHPDPHTVFSTGGEWDVVEFETDIDLLTQAQEIAERLEPTKLAALAKSCLLQMGKETTSLGELDSITDQDPELN